MISLIFEKEKTLKADALVNSDIYFYLHNTFNFNITYFKIHKNVNNNYNSSLHIILSNNHKKPDLLGVEILNKFVISALGHPTDNTKISHTITSNNTTTFVNFIRNFHSVWDYKLFLP